MNLRDYIVIIAAISWAEAILNRTTITAGSIVDPIGKLHFIKGKLIIDVDLTPPEELVEALADYADKLTKLQERMQGHMMLYLMENEHKDTQTIKHMDQRLNIKLSMTLDEIAVIQRSRWIRSRPRHKRGLINIGGELLKGLFGTATEKELKVVQKKVQAFGKQAKVLTGSYNGLLTDIRENHKIVVRMEKSLNEIINRQMKMQNMFILGEITILLDEINTLLTKINKIRSLIEAVTFHKYKRTLNQNNFPFVNFTMFKSYDREVSEKYGLTSPIPLEKETFNEYLSQAILLGHVADNQVRLILPYIETEEYDIWKFYQFPTKIQGRKGRYTMNIIEPYAIMSKDRQLVLVFGEEIFKYCSLPKDRFYTCFPVILMRPTNLTLCASSILRQNEVAQCDISKFDSDDPLIRWIEDRRYLSLPKPQQVTLMCAEEAPKEEWLSETSTIATQCEVRSPTLNIPSLKTLHKTISYGLTVQNLTMPETRVDKIDENFGPSEWIDPKWLNLTSPHIQFTQKDTYYHVMISLMWIVIVATLVIVIRRKFRRYFSPVTTQPDVKMSTISTTNSPTPSRTQIYVVPDEPHYATIRTPPRSALRRTVHYAEDNGTSDATNEEA